MRYILLTFSILLGISNAHASQNFTLEEVLDFYPNLKNCRSDGDAFHFDEQQYQFEVEDEKFLLNYAIFQPVDLHNNLPPLLSYCDENNLFELTPGRVSFSSSMVFQYKDDNATLALSIVPLEKNNTQENLNITLGQVFDAMPQLKDIEASNFSIHFQDKDEYIHQLEGKIIELRHATFNSSNNAIDSLDTLVKTYPQLLNWRTNTKNYGFNHLEVILHPDPDDKGNTYDTPWEDEDGIEILISLRVHNSFI